MSLVVTLPSSPFSRSRRPIRIGAALKGIDPTEILFKIGGFLAVSGFAVGIMLYGLGSLDLFWVMVLPIPTCGGGALLCLGILVLCVRDLRSPPNTLNFRTRGRNSV